MPNYAAVQLMGHLGRDAELKTTGSGMEILRFSIAVTTGYGDKKSTSWYECALFGKRAATLSSMLTKGKAVLIHGEPQIRKWTSESGKSGVSVDVKVAELAFVGGRDDERGERAPTPAEPEQATDDNGEIPF